MSFSAGDRLGRYEILAPIGAGGMGEVYRARDSELERDVAIKVLPEAVAQNPDRLARFEREAKAVAKLSHPNILEIHDYGREGDTTYAVTELLEGHSLQQALVGDPMPWKKAVDIGSRVADGLSAAHDGSVVHRDIKPSNIFVCTDGRVKILDFGLASLGPVDLEAETVSGGPLTREGNVMGTVGYMSPEQARGRSVDHRSDIFSLGCVLYEMVSGKGPFERGSSADTLAAILKEEPPPLEESGAPMGSETSKTIERCLEKQPERRFQTASDLAYNLRMISSGSAPSVSGPAPRIRDRRRSFTLPAIAAAALIAIVIGVNFWAPWEEIPQPTPEVVANRVAIAPLENRTGDPSLDTIGVMAADQIVHRFTETGAAEVMPLAEVTAATTGAFLGGQAHQAALRGGAAFLVSGAYYQNAGAIRLRARLVDTREAELIYVFEEVASSSSVGAKGVERLAERVLAGVAAHLYIAMDITVLRPPSSYEAFQACRRGFEIFGRDLTETCRQLSRALELDPQFHIARYLEVLVNIYRSERELVNHGLSFFEANLDRMLPFEQAFYEYLKAKSAAEGQRQLVALRRMLELAPQLLWVRFEMAIVALELNRPQAAADAVEPVIVSYIPGLYHLAPYPIEYMTDAQHMLGDYEKELEYANLGLEHFPDYGPLHSAKARALAAQGEIERANQVIAELLRIKLRGWTAGIVMSQTATEFQTHGHRQAGVDMAENCVEWFETHPEVLQGAPYGINHFTYFQALWIVGAIDRIEELVSQVEATGEVEFERVSWLGKIAAHRGDCDRAMQISDQMYAGDDPLLSARAAYWRASIAARLGDKDRAVDLLNRAFSNGAPYSIYLHQTANSEGLLDYPPFQELIRPKG